MRRSPTVRPLRDCANCGAPFAVRRDRPDARFCSADCRYLGLRQDPEPRFWVKVEKTESCWLWTGATNGLGYGKFKADPRTPAVYAHRYAYELVVGPIPEGLQLDHCCENPPCVNPAHLEPVTQAENVRRGFERRRATA